MKFILVVWLASPFNYAEYESFHTYEQCRDKLNIVIKALQQADSVMVAECWKVEPKA